MGNMFSGKNVFMELTNVVHGGEGWDFGEVLWSPVGPTWNIMEDIKAGDIIIHSLKKNGGHRIVGVSCVKRKAIVVNEEPLIPGRWKGYENYYRIEVQNYSELYKELRQKDFFDKYNKEIIALGDQHSFYALSSDKKRVLGAAQKYVARIPDSVQELISRWFDEENIKLFSDVLISDSEDDIVISEKEKTPPGRVNTTVSRIIRDTEMIRKMKKKYNNTCQICGKRIVLPNGKGYSEGHHLQKLGGAHKGPDIENNVIILCPYHHTEFDYGAIAINPETNIIEHIDKHNEFYKKPLAYERKDLGKEYLKYHFKHIYNVGNET